MSEPLSLLGEVIAGGARDLANQYRDDKLHARAREEHLADIAAARNFDREQADAARSFTKGQTTAGWQHEEKLYGERRFDALKNQLIQDGLLAPEDIGQPEAVKAAFEKGGKEYQRSVTELAGYKAAIPNILQATEGKAAGLQQVLNMTPADIATARGIMSGAYVTLGRVVNENSDKKDKNAINGAALMNAHIAKLAMLDGRQSELESEYERLSSGELKPEEVVKVRQLALSKLPQLASKAALTPSEKAILAAEMAKQEGDFRTMQTFGLQRQARELGQQQRYVNAQYEGVKAAIQTGAAAYMTPGETPAALGVPAKAAPGGKPSASTVEPGAGTASFVASLGGTPAAAAASSAPARTPVPEIALGDAPTRAPIPPSFGGDPMAAGAYAVGSKIGGMAKAGKALVGSILDGSALSGLNSLPADLSAQAAVDGSNALGDNELALLRDRAFMSVLSGGPAAEMQAYRDALLKQRRIQQAGRMGTTPAALGVSPALLPP